MAAAIASAFILAGCGPSAPEITVAMTEFSFEPAKINIQSGQKTVLVLQNKGGVEHNLALAKETIASRDVTPGETVRLEVTLPRGNHRFVCTVAGHEEAGMVGEIVSARR